MLKAIFGEIERRIKIKVLSLFDGISCGQVALRRAGIAVDKYYASEIEQHAITITMKNYPETIQLGDINNVQEWDLPKIDLIIGGSPCQDLSIAKANRKGLSGTKSGLFYKYIDALQKFKPTYFLLENNASMPQESKDEITRILGVEPILINSALVSAQNRKRLYWTNIPNISQPEDKNILLKDILEHGIVDRNKSLCVTRRYAGFGGSQSYLRRRYFGKSIGQAVFENTTPEKQKEYFKADPYKEFDDIGSIRQMTHIECERLQTLPDNYTYGIPSTARYEAIGNGWTVDVIAHILSHIDKDV